MLNAYSVHVQWYTHIQWWHLCTMCNYKRFSAVALINRSFLFQFIFQPENSSFLIINYYRDLQGSFLILIKNVKKKTEKLLI